MRKLADQEYDALMNKKPKVDTSHVVSGTSMTPVSLVDLEEVLRQLSKSISEESEHSTLVGVLKNWPFPLNLHKEYNGAPVLLDTDKYEFTVKRLLEVWDEVSMMNFIDRQFNEAEREDQVSLKNFFLSYNPNTKLKMNVLMDTLTNYFDERYPLPEPEVFASVRMPTNYNVFSPTAPDKYMPVEQKDYYLPGLKVLNLDSDGNYWSPMYPVQWFDNEMVAQHIDHRYPNSPVNSLWHDIQADAMQSCDCGIYASVNMSELSNYLNSSQLSAAVIGMDRRFGVEARRLCIIEPASNATVWLARKGWKATKAFISEIVGETISPTDAAELMSMVWKRPLDLRTLYRSQS